MSPKRISTGNGDDGGTKLLNGGRTSKSDLRIEALGAIDEAHAFIGLARAKCKDGEISKTLLTVQNHLYLINAELAFPGEESNLLKYRLGENDLQKLEEQILTFEDRMALPNKFILYGSHEVSALLDVARAVVRRAERKIVALQQQEPLGSDILLPYLNRLSDALFIMARYEESISQIPWQHPQID